MSGLKGRRRENMENRSTVAAYSAAHFAVDFACCYLITRVLYKSSDIYSLYLIYNFCAFAMQMPLGAAADRLNRNGLFALSGCILIALSYLAAGTLDDTAVAVILGIGNGAFHIGGGLDVLNLSGGRAAPLGVFVSPGALGLHLGRAAAKTSFDGGVIIQAAVLALGVVCALSAKSESGFISGNPYPEIGKLTARTAAAVGCFFIVVLIRAYFGLVMNFPWKGTGAYGFMLTCSVVLGKTAGGFLSDRFGPIKTSVLSLLSASALFLMCENPLCGIAAVFLFNMTMPITLWSICKIFDKCKGLAFGMLTFAMFVGLIPAYFGLSIYGGPAFCLCAVCSAAVLAAGLKLAGEKE